MTLQRYSKNFWFPDGALASNVVARVFPENSSALASLFTDGTGTTPLPNPTSTNGSGVLTFWAESGDYWVHLDTEAFFVQVGMTQEESDLSTGVASGGDINVNALDPLAIDIDPVDGYIVDYLAGDQSKPVVTRVKTPAQTVPLDAAALLRTVTWWLLDSGGNVIQQADRPDGTQRRTHIVLGATAQFGGAITLHPALPVILPQQANQLVDVMDALGTFSISGNAVTANGANLMIDQSAGSLFSRAFNHYNPALTNDPHIFPTQAQSPAQFRYGTRTTAAFGAPVTTVDVANYDVGGVVTPVGGGANSSTIQRLWLFATATVSEQLGIQYGQTVHSSLSSAVNAIGQTGFVVNPTFGQNATLIAWIAATRTATNLSDPAQAIIVSAGKFATP